MKTSREDLAAEVQSQLVTYLGSGKPINESRLTRALDFTGLSITDFARLKRIRFVLSEPVQAYLDKLLQRIRRIRTVSEVEPKRSQGELRGSIDWGQTIRERYSSNPDDRSRFVTRTPYTEYQIPENLVLKVLLSIIHETTTTVLDIDQDWRVDRWSDDEIDGFQQFYRGNIHLDRIDADANTQLQPRHLDAARRSRQPLYFNAYDRYMEYQRLLNNEFDDDAVAKILYETLIVPDVATLFELVCIFRLLDRFRTEFELNLRPIDKNHDAIARLDNDQWHLSVYHDAQGSLQFKESLPDTPTDEYLQRYTSVLQIHQTILDRSSTRPLYQGQPDIIVEAYEKQGDERELQHVLIGEIKHTDKKATFSSGVLELQEYLSFCRDPNRSSEDGGPPFVQDLAGVSITGLILTDDVRQRPQIKNTIHLNVDQLAKTKPESLLPLAESQE